MPIQLDAVEARILGSLVEKSLTTPDLYPLTFNALLLACNQKTSREPVMELDPDALGRGVQALVDKGLVERVNVAGSRVPKFKHHIEKMLDLGTAKEVGVVTVLLLRGPQTPGELKTRTERLCAFESSAEVEALLQELCAKPEPYLVRLPRQPGQKEARYQQLFNGAPSVVDAGDAAPGGGTPDRLAELERRVQALEDVVKALEDRLSKPV